MISNKLNLLLQWILLNKRPPSVGKELVLHTLYASFVNPSGCSYNADFRAKMIGLGYLRVRRRGEDVKKEIMDFVLEHKRRPSSHTEPKLARSARAYTNPANPCYDKKFKAALKATGFYRVYDPMKYKKEIKRYYKKNKRLPREWATMREERLLGVAMRRYSSPNHPSYISSYDPDFANWLKGVRE